MQEIKDDLKAIRADVSDIKTHVAVNTQSLTHHMERTRLNEIRVGKLETWTLGLLTAILVGTIGALIKALSG